MSRSNQHFAVSRLQLGHASTHLSRSACKRKTVISLFFLNSSTAFFFLLDAWSSETNVILLFCKARMTTAHQWDPAAEDRCHILLIESDQLEKITWRAAVSAGCRHLWSSDLPSGSLALYHSRCLIKKSIWLVSDAHAHAMSYPPSTRTRPSYPAGRSPSASPDQGP